MLEKYYYIIDKLLILCIFPPQCIVVYLDILVLSQ